MKARDLTGQRFEMLTALYPMKGRRDKCVVWMCQCDCGTRKAISSTDLTRHRVKSCGCLRHRAKDITGERRGHLVALAYTGEKDAKGHAIYNWRCDCGNVFARSICGTARDSACICPECQRKIKAQQIVNARKKLQREPDTGLAKQYLANLVGGVLTARNTSGVRGVYWHAGHRRWVATGRVDGKLVTLGEYEEIAEARDARLRFVESRYQFAAAKLGIEMG